MTTYTVAIRGDADASSRDTTDLDAALDWFTNAVTEVMDPEGDLAFATLAVDGKICGIIAELGVPIGGGEIIELKAA